MEQRTSGIAYQKIDKSPILGKRKARLLLETEKRTVKTKTFSKNTRLDELEPSSQSEQAEPKQWK